MEIEGHFIAGHIKNKFGYIHLPESYEVDKGMIHSDPDQLIVGDLYNIDRDASTWSTNPGESHSALWMSTDFKNKMAMGFTPKSNKAMGQNTIGPGFGWKKGEAGVVKAKTPILGWSKELKAYIKINDD